MTRLRYLFLFLIFSTTLSAQEPSKTPEQEKVLGGPDTRIPPESMPEYPGGIQAMYSYIQKNLKYPQMALDSNANGKCFVKFIVNTDGTVSDVTVLKGVPRCPDCDKEAQRVLLGLPERWKPGMQDGRAVRVYYTLPFSFKGK